ncbi:MAG TPA: methyltransferase domain-containing protein [Gammaproteobacteria bacterium]|nr:methyltransferase domain-containing protein [Gammaproteobacteria bacterium]
MSDTDQIFGGAIPEFYERYLVPLIFDPYARDLAARVASAKPQHVLEIAAGTGVVTRALASRLPATTHIVATDLNPPMIEHAKTLMARDDRIEWKSADAQNLPFEDESFDAVACQFGVMFFSDKARAFTEAHRVLKPGGHYYFSVWDDISYNEFADLVTRALEEMFPDDPPRFLPRTPHGHHDIERLRRDLKSAGFARISADTVQARSRAPSPREPALAYVQGTPLRSEVEARDPARLEEATTRASQAIAERFGAGAIDGRIRAHVLTALR